MSCRNSCSRPAPSDARMENSFSRSMARAKSMFATFPQAINSKQAHRPKQKIQRNPEILPMAAMGRDSTPKGNFLWVVLRVSCSQSLREYLYLCIRLLDGYPRLQMPHDGISVGSGLISGLILRRELQAAKGLLLANGSVEASLR